MTATEAIVARIIRRDGPLVLDKIAHYAGVSRRDAEDAVQTLRLLGEPIIDAGHEGLRYTDNPDELRRYIDSRLDRAKTILAAQQPLEQTERRLRQRDLVLGL